MSGCVRSLGFSLASAAAAGPLDVPSRTSHSPWAQSDHPRENSGIPRRHASALSPRLSTLESLQESEDEPEGGEVVEERLEAAGRGFRLHRGVLQPATASSRTRTSRSIRIQTTSHSSMNKPISCLPNRGNSNHTSRNTDRNPKARKLRLGRFISCSGRSARRFAVPSKLAMLYGQ